MSRSDRLLELVHLLGGRRPRSMKEMVRHFEVSERTLFRDLAALERRRIPLTRDEHGYRLVEGATLRPLRLTGEERALLRLALGNAVLGRQPHLARRLAVLEAKLDAVAAAAEETPEALALAALDRSGEIPREVFGGLERAAAAGTAVEILYASLSGGTRRWRGVDPYCIFRREGTWYLAGRCHLNDEPRSFRLDRIAGVRRLGPRFSLPERFDLERYLEGAWGIFRGHREHEIELCFSPKLAALVENARHHDGESWERLPDGSIAYRVRLTHLEEVARWVVGFGGDCRALAPEALRERVRKIAAGALEAEASRW